MTLAGAHSCTRTLHSLTPGWPPLPAMASTAGRSVAGAAAQRPSVNPRPSGTSGTGKIAEKKDRSHWQLAAGCRAPQVLRHYWATVGLARVPCCKLSLTGKDAFRRLFKKLLKMCWRPWVREMSEICSTCTCYAVVPWIDLLGNLQAFRKSHSVFS